MAATNIASLIILVTFSYLLSPAQCLQTHATNPPVAARLWRLPPHPPMPTRGYQWPPKDWPHWHFVTPPTPAAGGFKWPPNRPWPHWEFVQPPIPAGSHWSPKEWPHWHFVQPPMPAGGSKVTATKGAAPAARGRFGVL